MRENNDRCKGKKYHINVSGYNTLDIYVQHFNNPKNLDIIIFSKSYHYCSQRVKLLNNGYFHNTKYAAMPVGTPAIQSDHVIRS